MSGINAPRESFAQSLLNKATGNWSEDIPIGAPRTYKRLSVGDVVQTKHSQWARVIRMQKNGFVLYTVRIYASEKEATMDLNPIIRKDGSHDESDNTNFWFAFDGGACSRDMDECRPLTPPEMALRIPRETSRQEIRKSAQMDTSTTNNSKVTDLSAQAVADICRNVLTKHAQELHERFARESGPVLDGILTKKMVELTTILLDDMRGQVGEHLAALNLPRALTITQGESTVTISGAHPKLDEAVQIASAINNIWLCGPAGSGKTTLAKQMAEAMDRPFGFISCTVGMSEAKILGRMNVHGTYLCAEFVRIYETGGIFLFDEFDAADPNVVLAVNSAMANGYLSVPDRVDAPVAVRHARTVLVMATNTWGRGSSSEYTARESLDAATRDRFVLSKIGVDYSSAIEFQFLGTYVPKPVKSWSCPKLKHKLQHYLIEIRANIDKHHLRRILSTRVFAQAAALRGIGWTDERIIERYFLDWTDQERTKALEGLC